MAQYDQQQPRPLTDLLGGLASDISGLFRKEVQLAKAEASEKLEAMVAASKGLAIGGVMAIGAIGVALSALVSGLGWILERMGLSEPAADFIAAVVVAAVIGAIAWSMISKSTEAWKANRLSLDRTTHSLARDAEVVKESI